MPRDITFLVIHCSATPNGRWTTSADINLWHHDRGFRRKAEARVGLNPKLDAIGYHQVIYTNGTVATGRGPNEVGAHVAGNNTGSLGICMVGTDRFHAEQWDALRRLVWQLCAQYRIPQAPADPKDPRGLRGVIGHGEIPGVAKSCPGFSVREWLLAGMNPNPQHILQG
ncbi:MAG: N-acetylmuramoyl-L-alanine amidase [Zoogloea sp.]|nr:N-acetylmuramoyl-L-alanine amidase [Zoogloea sp.]MCA0186043.1 N-acetylmuramoyl-L-alanine amidase [Pseudomonadota bacterium]